jgi:hypothetical protein
VRHTRTHHTKREWESAQPHHHHSHPLASLSTTLNTTQLHSPITPLALSHHDLPMTRLGTAGRWRRRGAMSHLAGKRTPSSEKATLLGVGFCSSAGGGEGAGSCWTMARGVDLAWQLVSQLGVPVVRAPRTPIMGPPFFIFFFQARLLLIECPFPVRLSSFNAIIYSSSSHRHQSKLSS